MSAPLTELDLAAIKARVATATKGPWFGHYCGIYSEPMVKVYTLVERDGTLDEAAREKLEEYLDPQIGWVPAIAGDTPGAQATADSIFISNAREDVPALIAEIERLRAEAVK